MEQNKPSGQALDIAVKMLHQQHARWYQWSIFFFGSVTSVFVVWHQTSPYIHLSVAASIASVLCFAWTIAALNIRGQTRSWDKAVTEIEEKGDSTKAFETFRKNLENWSRWDDFIATLQLWSYDSNARVTRLLLAVSGGFTALLAVLAVYALINQPIHPLSSNVDSAVALVTDSAPAQVEQNKWSGFDSLIGAIVQIGLLLIGVFGLATWRHQLKGKTEYELSRRVLHAAYRVRDALSKLRNTDFLNLPVTTIRKALEADGCTSKEIETAVNERSIEDLQHYVLWGKLEDAFSDLRLECSEAEVLWGPEIHKRTGALRKCASDLKSAIRQYRDFRERPDKDGSEWERLDAIVNERSDDPAEDVFTKRIHCALTEIEAFVKPKLKL